jgi:hypothetical protein
MATKSSSKKSSSARKTANQSAATKASKQGAKGQDATKTPSKASKSSKIDHRRPAVMPGDLAGAEYNPARTEEGDRVAQTGMNPRASRAGLLVDLPRSRQSKERVQRGSRAGRTSASVTSASP